MEQTKLECAQPREAGTNDVTLIEDLLCDEHEGFAWTASLGPHSP